MATSKTTTQTTQTLDRLLERFEPTGALTDPRTPVLVAVGAQTHLDGRLAYLPGV